MVYRGILCIAVNCGLFTGTREISRLPIGSGRIPVQLPWVPPRDTGSRGKCCENRTENIIFELAHLWQVVAEACAGRWQWLHYLAGFWKLQKRFHVESYRLCEDEIPRGRKSLTRVRVCACTAFLDQLKSTGIRKYMNPTGCYAERPTWTYSSVPWCLYSYSLKLSSTPSELEGFVPKNRYTWSLWCQKSTF